MDKLTTLNNRIFTAKIARRKEQAALPMHEKIKILVKLQKMTAPLMKAQGKQVKVWEL